MRKQAKPYQQLLSALFGLLYLFIVTPVQYWHQHPPKDTKTAEQVYIYQFHADGDNADINCSICSHKYSGYQLQIDEPFLTLLPNQAISYTHKCLPVMEGIYATLCNKGPPTISA